MQVKNSNSLPRRQRGMTTVALVGLLAILAFFVMLTMVLLPVYLENFKVRSHLNGLVSDSNLKDMSEGEILDTLFRRFSIDDVDNVSRDDVTLERLDDDHIKITIDYEVRKPTVGNVDVVVSFVESASTE